MHSARNPSRRACMAAAAAVMVAPTSAQPASRLDRLVADWRDAEVRAKALNDHADRILREADLPVVCVEVGPYRCRYPHQVHGLFDRWIDGDDRGPQPRDVVERLTEQREALVSDLLHQEDALIAAELACGLTAADDAAGLADDLARKLKAQIFGYQPQTLDEAATKNIFLLDWVRAGRELSSDDLALIFGGLPDV